MVGFSNFLADIHNRLGASKKKVIRRMLPTNKGETFNLNIRVSDALLIGYLTNEDVKHLKKDQLKMIEPFQGKKAYRFGLSSYFVQLEK